MVYLLYSFDFQVLFPARATTLHTFLAIVSCLYLAVGAAEPTSVSTHQSPAGVKNLIILIGEGLMHMKNVGKRLMQLF